MTLPSSNTEHSTVCLKASGEQLSQALAIQSLHQFMNSVFHMCNSSVSEMFPHVSYSLSSVVIPVSIKVSIILLQLAFF